MPGYWRIQMRDVVELLLPALATLLPWPVCFRLFSWLAQWDWLYREATQRAVEQARQSGWLGTDELEWARRRRLVTLIDHADFFLARTRSDAWLRRYVRVQGQWPCAGQAAVLCTFHWGAGMWALRHAQVSGMHAHLLVASLNKAHFKGRPVLHAYAKARIACCNDELGRLTLDVSSNRRAILRALNDNEQIMAVIDVPADGVGARQAVTVLGRQAQVPRGLMRLAVDRQVPITLFLTGIDFETGRRFLNIKPLGMIEDVDVLSAKAFTFLDEALRSSPPSWHFWSEAHRFFVDQAEQDGHGSELKGEQFPT